MTLTDLPPIPDDVPAAERPLHEEVRAWLAAVDGPGVGRVSGGQDPAVSPDGATLALTGVRWQNLLTSRQNVIALVDVAGGDLRVVSDGPWDHRPRWSPDGDRLAWVSWRDGEKLHRAVWAPLADPSSVTPVPLLGGNAEAVDWSPDGRRLLVVAHDEPPAAQTDPAPPSWWPRVERSEQPTDWRHAQVVDLADGRVRRVSAPGRTVWEAVWAGDDAVAAVSSTGPGEDAWYRCQVMLYPVAGADAEPAPGRVLHTSEVQLGRPAASPSGRYVSVVEGLCSDRSLVAADLVVIPTDGGPARRLDTAGVDVAWSSWRGDDVVCFVGVRRLQTVAGEVDLATGEVRELWVSDGSTAGVYPQVAHAADGTVLAVAESYRQPPRVVAVRDGAERVVVDLAHEGHAHLLAHGGTLERVSWAGRDGLPIDGLLLRPPAEVAAEPYPLVLDIHGGPVWAWHDQFAMRGRSGPVLASRGYAVLYVNPRGSTGRGQAFAAGVAHDMHGADTGDFLRGIDHLVEAGTVDPGRVGVTGTSYGGSMSLWLATQDERVRAAVPISGASNLVSFHFTTSITDFDLFFLPGDPLEPAGEYVARSPLSGVRRVVAPVRHLVGERDADVPPSQGVEMHRALTVQGGISELVRYPEQGHGVDDYPATADAVSRTLAWFERYLAPDGRG